MPVVTTLLAAVFALMLTGMSLAVSLRRREKAIARGDGDDDTLWRRMRAFRNFAEYAPMMLIVLALVELSGAPNRAVAALAGAFLLSRVLHAAGMYRRDGLAMRAAGMIVQHLAFVAAACGLLWMLAAGGAA
ncbi:MAG: MAPEG family protein [Flavobacteriaceae bacterium]